MKAEAIFLNNIGSVIWFTGNANHILTINSNFKKKKKAFVNILLTSHKNNKQNKNKQRKTGITIIVLTQVSAAFS